MKSCVAVCLRTGGIRIKQESSSKRLYNKLSLFCAGLLWEVRPLPGVSQTGRRRQMDAGAQDGGESSVGIKSTFALLSLLSPMSCHCQLNQVLQKVVHCNFNNRCTAPGGGNSTVATTALYICCCVIQ